MFYRESSQCYHLLTLILDAQKPAVTVKLSWVNKGVPLKGGTWLKACQVFYFFPIKYSKRTKIMLVENANYMKIRFRPHHMLQYTCKY